MSVLECPSCEAGTTTCSGLLKHIRDTHLPDDLDDLGTCPECKANISESTYTLHVSCFVDIDHSEVEFLRGGHQYLCQLCGNRESEIRQLTSHLKNHRRADVRKFLGAETYCAGCDKQIGDHADFSDHIGCLENDLDPDGRHSCPYCASHADTKSKIFWHIWTDHWGGNSEVEPCPGCDQSISIHEIRNHLTCIDESEPHAVMALVSPRYSNCFICDYDAFNKRALAEHIKTEHAGSDIASTCPDCGERSHAISDQKFERHYLSLAKEAGISLTVETSTTYLRCPACTTRVDKHDSLVEHINDEHNQLFEIDGECNVCNQPFSGSDHTDCLVNLGTKIGEAPIPQPPNLSQRQSPETTLTSVSSLGPSETTYRNELLEFVSLEREQKRETAWNEYNELPLYELTKHRNCIEELVPLGKQHNPHVNVQYVFERPVPENEYNPTELTERFGIFPRQQVILGSTHNGSALPIEASVTFTDDQTIGISPKQGDNSWSAVHNALTNDDADFHIVDLLNPTPYDRERDATKEAFKTDRIRKPLTGKATLTETNIGSTNAYTGLLNNHQRTAVERALGADTVFCIHGPPGTGKTRTLTALIELAAARGDRVLACAHSNPAIDNLLVGSSQPDAIDEDSLHATVHHTDIEMARVGHHSENAVVNGHYSHVPRAAADIIGSTTNAAAVLDADSFDLVVVDEATQASQPATLVPWLKGTPLVLAGDHRQLPPYCSNETAKDEELHVSLFEHLFNLYGSSVSERLDIQYRMNREIANFASEAFYDRPLQHGPENADWTIGDLESIIGLNVVGDEETTDQTSSKFNSIEADVVARSVKHLLTHDVNAADIGIITPYTAQIREIREALGDQGIDGRSNIKIDTIDSFQGSEREAIIVSFVRSNPYNSSGFLTFPDEGKLRLNVALTRARRRLVLVGNWETLSKVADHKSPDESSADLYAQLHDYLTEMGRLRDVSL